MLSMFKKTINILLLLIVFSVTTGFSVSLHYCCDSLVSMSVNSDATPCCPVDNGCCDNETQHIQLEEDVTIQSSDNIEKIETQHAIIDVIIVQDNIYSGLHQLTSNLTDLSPPRDLQENLSFFQSFLL